MLVFIPECCALVLMELAPGVVTCMYQGWSTGVTCMYIHCQLVPCNMYVQHLVTCNMYVHCQLVTWMYVQHLVPC